MRIQIETVPHAQQRYETTGDWWWDPDDTLQMRVSALADWRHSVLIAVHELVEALLCKAQGSFWRPGPAQPGLFQAQVADPFARLGRCWPGERAACGKN